MTDLDNLAVGGADEGDGVLLGDRDGDGGDVAVGREGESGLTLYRVGTSDWLVHFGLATVVVCDIHLLQTHRSHIL